MKHWYQNILRSYENQEYTVQLQAKYLRAVIVFVVLIIPVFFPLDVLSQQGFQPRLHIPQLAIWIVAIFSGILLSKGHLQLSGHVLVWSFIAELWLVIFEDPAPEIVARTDTIIITLAVLAIVPLLHMTHRVQLWSFHLANLVLFSIYCIVEYRRGQLVGAEFWDFVIDTGVALVAFAVISNAVFTVYVRAFSRLQEEKNEVEHARLELRRTIDGMPSLLMSIDSDCRVIGWNQTVEKTTKVAHADAMGKLVFDAFSFLTSYEESVCDVARGAEVFFVKKLTLPALDTNGSNRLFSLTVYPLIPNEPAGAVLRLDDITEQVRMEMMMIQTEKMMSVGGLAAGMAHEINNPLAGIIQNAQLLEFRLSSSSAKNQQAAKRLGLSMSLLETYFRDRRIEDIVVAIRESGVQASKVVSNMLSFAREELDTHQLINPVTMVEETLALASNEYDLKKNYDFRKIKIHTEFAERLPDIYCSKGMIQQVLLNLFRNSAQAMVANPASRPAEIRVKLDAASEHVRFEVADNGPGILPEVLGKVFEPFYTTKAPGSGTGLGLSVSYFIVTETHGGQFRVESVPHEYTSFVFELPIEGKDTVAS